MKVTCTGNLSQENSGDNLVGATISIAIGKPDGSVDALNATTDGSGNFSVTGANDYPPGPYTAQASFAGDSDDNPGQSDVVPFTVGLDDVVLTLNVATS